MLLELRPNMMKTIEKRTLRWFGHKKRYQQLSIVVMEGKAQGVRGRQETDWMVYRRGTDGSYRSPN